jgi:AhpD family alkylhydroperoxidase
MKKLLFASVLLAASGLVAQAAGQPPQWMQEVFTGQELQAAWQDYKAVYHNPNAALDAKTLQLIGLGVAAQIPCQYCIYAHTALAKKAGASEQEIKEAVAAAAETRKLSTMLNGMQYDMAKFKAELGGATASTASN